MYISILIKRCVLFDSLSIKYDSYGKFTFILPDAVTALPNITRVYLSQKEFDWLRKNRSDLTYMHKVNCSNYMHIWLFDCCIFMHVLNRSRMDCWWWMMVNIFFLLVRCLRTSRNTFCVRLLHNTYDRHERMKHCCIFINTN